jgi:hypothetical protein
MLPGGDMPDVSANCPGTSYLFHGLLHPDGRIISVSLDYGKTPLSESIDDLYFAPRRGIPPTRTPLPTWTPVPTIINPSNGSYTIPGGLVVLMGTAMDMEDGSLPDSSLVWSSDRQGELGVGPSVALNSLESGTHIITLTATDSYGISMEAHVQINIAYPLFTPLLGRN